MDIKVDVLIVGTGAAGLYCALNLREDLNILIVSKGKLTECNSYLAQGGISTAVDNDDIMPFAEDTMRAGSYKNNRYFVEIMCRESMDNIKNLIGMGVPFNRDRNGSGLCYTREGAHGRHRIVYCRDNTGKYLVDTLLDNIRKRKNITLMEQTRVVDLISDGYSCLGAVAVAANMDKDKVRDIDKNQDRDRNQEQLNIYAKNVVLATGGIGGLFKNSTNLSSITGDSLYMALKYNIELKDVAYIQFHPTALYKQNNASGGRRFLVSESVRGEGGRLYDAFGRPFVNELLPRDMVTKAINGRIASTGIPYVYLDTSHLPSEYIKKRFPMIYKECLQEGIDIMKDPIPVSPAQHYFMGGIKVNAFAQTSLAKLYAIGEASCTGVHGSNRLASNSLLEGLVFSNRAAGIINIVTDEIQHKFIKAPALASSMEEIEALQRETVINLLKRRARLNDELFGFGQDNKKCIAGGYAMV